MVFAAGVGTSTVMLDGNGDIYPIDNGAK